MKAKPFPAFINTLSPSELWSNNWQSPNYNQKQRPLKWANIAGINRTNIISQKVIKTGSWLPLMLYSSMRLRAAKTFAREFYPKINRITSHSEMCFVMTWTLSVQKKLICSWVIVSGWKEITSLERAGTLRAWITGAGTNTERKGE